MIENLPFRAAFSEVRLMVSLFAFGYDFGRILTKRVSPMRKVYHEQIKEQFHQALVETRMRNAMSQAQMAEKLAMDERSYVDLDHGKTCCSTVTLVLFLLYVCEDREAFLEELKRALDAENDRAA